MSHTQRVDVVLNKVPGTGTAYAGYAVAVVTLIMWALSTYVFHGHMPDGIEAAIVAIVPGLMAWIASRVTRSATQATDAQAAPPGVQLGTQGSGNVTITPKPPA